MTAINSVPSNNDELIQCYNKGCGTKFKFEDNNEDSCCFHPGAPIFHDAYKGWSCCNKKSTDFTTFLNLKGCTEGKHNPVKPEEPVKQKPDAAARDEVITVAPPQETCMERPDFNIKLERLKVTISQSLREALNKERDKESETTLVESNLVVKVGECCKNNGCKVSYEGEHSNLGICIYHPGFPIFHEGLKYWYCCQRKTTDFEVFLQQQGCTTGSHVWVKKNLKKTTCRFDWHQTSTHVIVTVYAKLSRPEFSHVDVNPIRLLALIAFADNQEFDVDNELGGIIIPSESSITMAAAKVEIKLRKAEPKHWNKIFLPPKQDKNVTDETHETEEETPDPNLNVDAIDLNDL